MGRWQIANAEEYSGRLEHLLAEGYEPFAVTEDDRGRRTVWLKRWAVFGDVPVKAVKELRELHNPFGIRQPIVAGANA